MTQARARRPARKPTQKEREKLLDGARYWTDDALPSDYLTDSESGLRPGESKPPNGTVLVDLSGFGNTAAHCILPTRTMWKKGKWKSMNDTLNDDYYTWVIDGEGTPGNYLERHYLLPEERATEAQIPKHPADWPKKKDQTKTGYYSTSGTQAKTKAPSLPFGVRFRHPGCGHWFKENDLAGHAQVCPGEVGDADWAIACECCTSLDDTCKTKPGFPRKVAVPAAKPEKAEKKPTAKKG